MQHFIARYSYPHLEMPGVVVVDCDNGRFMNHTLTPNTDFRIFDKGYALVDIAQGDEITCNYHEFDPTFAGFFPHMPGAAAQWQASCQRQVGRRGLALAACLALAAPLDAAAASRALSGLCLDESARCDGNVVPHLRLDRDRRGLSASV